MNKQHTKRISQIIEFRRSVMNDILGPEQFDEKKRKLIVEDIPYLLTRDELTTQLMATLREIAKGEGRFSRDPLTHADNCIDDMKEMAVKAIVKIEKLGMINKTKPRETCGLCQGKGSPGAGNNDKCPDCKGKGTVIDTANKMKESG